MADITRTVKVRFDGDEKGLLAAAAKAGIAVEGFEKQARKSMTKLSSTVSDGLIDALGALPSQLKGAAIVAAAGIGLVMAPALASAIVSGVLLAVGGGVLAAGIVGAAKHPKVTRAWQRFGQQAGKVFDRFSAPFVKPLVNAADIFSRALRRAEPTIQAIGRTIAPVLDKLPVGLAMMAEKLLPGILAAAQASVPLFDVLSANLPGLGTALTVFLEALAAGGPTAQVFFDNLLKWVQDVLGKLGGFITWVQDFKNKIEEFTTSPEFVALKKELTDLGEHILKGLEGAFKDLDTSVDANAESWNDLYQGALKFLDVAGPVLEWVLRIQGWIWQLATTVLDLAIKQFKMWIDTIEATGKALGKLWELFKRGHDIVWGGGGKPKVPIPANLPEFHGGGTVPGPRGAEVPILAQGGETVFTPEQLAALGRTGASEVVIPIYIGDEVVRVVRMVLGEHNRQTRRAVMAGAGAR